MSVDPGYVRLAQAVLNRAYLDHIDDFPNTKEGSIYNDLIEIFLELHPAQIVYNPYNRRTDMERRQRYAGAQTAFEEIGEYGCLFLCMCSIVEDYNQRHLDLESNLF